jgi:hypothetical protein
MAQPPNSDVDQFIARWQSARDSERANYQLFAHELCNNPLVLPLNRDPIELLLTAARANWRAVIA